MTERRMYKRHRADLEVDYKVNNTIEIKSRTRTVNICEGGICMPLNKAVKVGKKVLMRIKVPSRSDEVTAVGKVVWKEPRNDNLPDEEEAGIKFLGVYENGGEALAEYIHSIA